MKSASKTATASRRLLLASLVIGVTLFPGIARSGPPCVADIEKFCSKVPIGDGRIQTCLKEHEKELAPECAARHEGLEKEMGRLAATCRYDIARFCWDVAPGGGRLARCLEENERDLTPVCKDQVRQAGRPPG
jgi:hypothetical protein